MIVVVVMEAFQVENIYGYNKCIYTTSNYKYRFLLISTTDGVQI